MTAINVSGVLTKDGFAPTPKPKLKYDAKDVALLNHVLKFDSLNGMFLPQSMNIIDFKTDSVPSNFMRDSLTFLIKEVMTTWYPDYNARSLLPFVKKGSAGYDLTRYTEKEWTGRAKQAGKKSTGMKMVESSVKPVYKENYKMEVGAEYSIYELENAILMQESIQADKLMNTKDSHELALNECAFGISQEPEDAGIPGLLNQPDMTITDADYATTLADVDIYSETATNNYDWLVGVINTPHEFTKKARAIPDTLGMPIEAVNFLNAQRMNNIDGSTVLSEIFKNTSIKKVIACDELNGHEVNGVVLGKSLLCFRSDNEILEFVENVLYSILPTYTKPTSFIIPTRATFSGVFIYRKAIALVKDIGTKP